MNSLTKHCPVCKHENLYNALACQKCGSILEENPTDLVEIPEEAPGSQADAIVENVEQFVDVSLIPENGVGIRIVGAPKPYYVHVTRELVIGRETGATASAFLNLSNLDAFAMGVSRRHVKLRRTNTGYEVIDLGSRNGTWLNAERLVPNKPYPFASGSQLRIGQMRLLIAYRAAPEKRTAS